MSYIVNFTDRANKSPITVYDNTSSVDTTLVFPGRNVTGYGQAIAENFLHLMEHFASENEPVNPVLGQIWYDSLNEFLRVWDNETWKAASGIRRSPTMPNVIESAVGELWVDTTNQQLYIFTGSRWLLVGPPVGSTDGLKNGPAVESIVDTDNNTQSITSIYISDIPVSIFSKNSFIPKTGIPGFASIKAGVNINSPDGSTEYNFQGGYLPKLTGIATGADSLIIADSPVSSNKFMRTDADNTTDFGINIRTNKGLTIGSAGNLILSYSGSSAKIYNSAYGSMLELQVNNNGLPDSIMRIAGKTVSINKVPPATPDTALDIVGNLTLTGRVNIGSPESNSFVTAGGASIARDLLVGYNLTMGTGQINSGNIMPLADSTHNLGTDANRWSSIYADTIEATNIIGNFVLNGVLDGVVKEAQSLTEDSTFEITGDVVASPVDFNGALSEIKLDTTLSSDIISARDDLDTADASDEVLISRDGTENTLYKQTRENFIADLGMPLGAILPFAGQNVPYGYLLCDGSEVSQYTYPELFSLISDTYKVGSYVGMYVFQLPDLRGRFALGRDNMNNDPAAPGGGTADRVSGADDIGDAGGSSTSVLELSNLPDHTHDLQSDGVQFSTVIVDPTPVSGATTGDGPTDPDAAQYFDTSGNITKPTPEFEFSEPVDIVNPFLTINYIIRSGPPVE